MDAINDYYMEELDLLAMKRFFWEQGERRILEKQDYFVRQGERSGRVAYVEDGMFRFVRTDTKGGEHIVGYSFRDSFVAEYTSCLCGRPALADVQAIVRSTLYVLPYEKLRRYWEMSPEHQRLGRIVAEHLPPFDGQLLLYARRALYGLDEALSRTERTASSERNRFVYRGDARNGECHPEKIVEVRNFLKYFKENPVAPF